MNKKTLLLSVFSVFTYFAVTSYSGGPAHNGLGDVTGGSGGTCSNLGCHTTGPGTTNGSIEVRKKSLGSGSMPVTTYVAGETYIITLIGSNITPGLDDFGFQFTTQKSADNTYVGTYSNLGTQVHGFPQSAPTLIEHNTLIPKTSGNYLVSFDWTAPSAGVGQVNMYCIINAVNDDNFPTGDKPSNTISLSLADKTSVGEVSKEVVFKAYPNPVQNTLTLDLTKADAGTYIVQAYTSAGSIVSKSELNIRATNYTGTINTTDWKPGMYFVRIQKDGNIRVMPVLKQ